MRRILLLATLLLAAIAPAISAQGNVRVEVSVDPFTKDPSVQVRNLFGDPRWRDALDDAFRISLEWKVELWKSRIIDANISTNRFTMVVRREPLLGQYFITYYNDAGDLLSELAFTSRIQFAAALEQPVPLLRIGPKTEGNWYYAVELSITALSDAEFAELERFIGAGERNSVTGALSGVLLKLFGTPSQKVTARVPVRVP